MKGYRARRCPVCGRRLGRTRRVVKWTGLFACVLIVAAWGASLRWEVLFVVVETDTAVVLVDGIVFVMWANYTLPPGNLGEPGWRVTRHDHGGAFQSQYGFLWPAPFVPLGLGGADRIPCWFLLLVAAIPTVFLFWRDRRRYPPGHCQKCGYDLTGNESGVCSECGTPCPAESGVR